MAIVDNIKKISHAALKVSDVDAQVEFYSDMVGLGETARDEQGRAYMRCNADHHCLVLMPSDGATGIDHFALDVGDAAGVEAAANALDGAGIKYDANGSDELGQGLSLRVDDPEGFSIELIAGMELVAPVYGTRAVQPRRIAHVTLLVGDTKASAEFYTDVLGFRVSDWFEQDFVWLRCNPEHHSLALAKLGRIGLHHVAYDVLNVSALAHQGDHLARNGLSYIYGPGRHGPGHNQFAYFYDLDKHIVEFTCDSQQIWDDASHTPGYWTADQKWINVWGQDPPPEFLE